MLAVGVATRPSLVHGNNHDAISLVKMEEEKANVNLGIKALFRSSRIYRHSRSWASRTGRSPDCTGAEGRHLRRWRRSGQMEATE